MHFPSAPRLSGPWLALLMVGVGCGAPLPASTVPSAPHPSVCAAPFHAQGAASVSPAARTLIHAGRLIDGVSAEPKLDVDILVDGDHIAAVGPHLEPPADVRRIDLSNATVMAGLIDAHTHLLHPGEDYLRGLVGASISARVLVASAAARTALGHGFTSLRDVESEGAMYADADLKQAINAGTVLGPRLWVSTRGIATQGGYMPLDGSWELDLPSGAQFVVGADQARAAVREQIAHGADWIKVYVDFMPLSLDDGGRIRGALNFTAEELRAITDEAHRLGRKVAAHAISYDGIAQALAASVDSLEHAHGLAEDLARKAAEQGVFVCPTLLAEAQFLEHMPPAFRAVFEAGYTNLARAFRLGVRFVYGTDLGSVPWSINGATGFALYAQRLHMTPAEVLRAATVSGAELLGQPGKLGQITPGALADLIAVPGDPLTDLRQLEQVTFVMKGGAVVQVE